MNVTEYNCPFLLATLPSLFGQLRRASLEDSPIEDVNVGMLVNARGHFLFTYSRRVFVRGELWECDAVTKADWLQCREVRSAGCVMVVVVVVLLQVPSQHLTKPRILKCFAEHCEYFQRSQKLLVEFLW